MSLATLKAETVDAKFANIPTMAPRPTHNNINAWEKYAIDVLSAIPSQQSADHGYQGMVQHPKIYALVCSVAWEEWADPGPTRRGTEYCPHPEFGTNLTPAQIKTEEAIYEARLAVFKNERVVKQAIIDCLNRCVPESYRRNQGIGTRVYKIGDDPRTIIKGLRDRYGTATPQEKEQNETLFGQGWNTANETFEDMTARLEDCFVTAVHAGPPYTVEQMLDKGLTGVKKTGLYQTALLEWNGFDDDVKTWDGFKAHFAEAYGIHLQTTQTSGQFGYHNANAVMDDDDSSITTITESLANLQTVSIENTRTMNDNISQLTATTNDLRQGLVQAQMALAAIARQQQPMIPSAQPSGWAALQANVPPVPYVAPPPQYGTPATQYQGYGGGRGRGRGQGGNNSRGRGRGNNRGSRGGNNGGGRGVAPGPPTAGGGIPAPPTMATQTQQPMQMNYTKYFNNWNMCCTCGFDVQSWHTSMSCPHKARNPHHSDAIDRNNYQAYKAAGWNIRMKAAHKNQLPSNPGPAQQE